METKSLKQEFLGHHRRTKNQIETVRESPALFTPWMKSLEEMLPSTSVESKGGGFTEWKGKGKGGESGRQWAGKREDGAQSRAIGSRSFRKRDGKAM